MRNFKNKKWEINNKSIFKPNDIIASNKEKINYLESFNLSKIINIIYWEAKGVLSHCTLLPSLQIPFFQVFKLGS